MSLRKFWEMVKDKEAWHAAVHGVARVRQDRTTEQQKTLIYIFYFIYYLMFKILLHLYLVTAL